jgi:S1-C subfamily serine protease
MSHEIAEGLGLSRIAGAVVTRLYDKGPAVRAGLQAGDVVTHVDEVEVTDARAVYYRLTTKGIGQSAHLTVLRNGEPIDIMLPLLAAPKPGKNDVRNLSGRHPLDGARISNILPSVADELGIDHSEGVVIISVRNHAAAQTLGFQPGDIIVAIGGKEIQTVQDAEEALSEHEAIWQISMKRGDQVLQLSVQG